jgi:hypothetical protein
MTDAEFEEARARLAKRAQEIETHVAKFPGYYPEAIQHAADLRWVLARLVETEDA